MDGTEHNRIGNKSENKRMNAQHDEINKRMGAKSEFMT